MNRGCPLSAILACALGVFSPSAAPQQQFRIAGVVVDSVSGAPIERAEVAIAPVANLDDAFTTLSASNGQFVFANLAPGKYRLFASRVGYTQQGLDQHEGFMTAIAVGPKLDSEHIRFRLFRESVIAGNVSDESGEPVRNAELFLFRSSFSGGTRATQPAGRATTDDLGDYRFPHLAPGTYFVVAHAKPWYSTGSQQVIDRVKASDVTILTRTLYDLDGHDDAVSSDSVEPQPHEVRPEAQLEPPPPPNRLRDVVYPLAFYSHADSLDSSTPLVLGPGATATADFSLHPTPALHILVKGPMPLRDSAAQDDSPHDPTRRYIDFTGAYPLSASLQIAGTDVEQLPVQPSPQMPGYFEVSNVPPGEIAFRSIERGGGGLTVQATLQQLASENRIDLSSSASVSVSGTVDPAPHPSVAAGFEGIVSQAFLSLTSTGGHTTLGTQVNAKGEFSLAVPPGNYTVGFTPPELFHIASLQASGAEISAHSITISPGMSVKLTVHLLQASATVSGVALKNGRPCASAMIVLVPEDSTQSAPLFHRDQSDSDGTFTMSPILPGRYTLLAIENGWDLEWSKLCVLFPYLAGGVPLEVKPGASVSINVKVQ